MDAGNEKMIVTNVKLELKSYYAAPMSYEYCAEVKVRYKDADYYVMVCYNDYGTEIIAVGDKELLPAWTEGTFDDGDTLLFLANDFNMEGVDEEEIPEMIEEATDTIDESEFCNAIRFARLCADTFLSFDTAGEKYSDVDESAAAAIKHIDSLNFMDTDINEKADDLPWPSYLPEEWKI